MAKTIKLVVDHENKKYPVTAEYSEDAFFQKDQTLVKIRRDDLPFPLKVGDDYTVEGFQGVDSMLVISDTGRNWILRFSNP